MDTPPACRPQDALTLRKGLRAGLAGMLGRAAGVLGVALLVLPGTAWAIPSPDVLVNMFASAAQVLGLATVVLGRWFVVSGRRKLAKGQAASGAGYRTAFLFTAGLFVATLVGWGMSSSFQSDLRNQRLQININRNSREDGKAVADVSLKELSFSDQQTRRDGIQTEELGAIIDRGEKPQMLDIRETEEWEVGGIAGVKPVRFPDLMANPGQYIRKSQPVYLFCANGNRSSELASFLGERGFDCRFLVGGYEKWLSEDRPLEMRGNRKRKELRELPEFPNMNVLLDTPDVMALLEKRKEVLFSNSPG